MWLSHVQLLDSALPIGTFSHSFGLETAVQQGGVRDVATLQAYLETMLRGAWAPADVMGIKAVYQYVPGEVWEQLWALDQALYVQRAAREAREGQQKMSKQLLRLMRAMYPSLYWSPLVEAIAEKRCVGSYPIVCGWTTYHLDVPLEAAVEGYLYSCVSAAINNAVRLMLCGQTQGQTLLVALLPTIHGAWLEVAAQEPEDFYTTTPAAEIYMMQHETLYSRLFMS